MKIACDLNKCFLCQHCQPAWKELISLKKDTRIYKKGQPIFSEGDPVEGMFFIYEGAVKVHRQWGKDKDLILHFGTGGDVLGYRGTTGGIYPVTATPLDATTACFVPQSFLEATFQANPGFLYQMMQLYADALQQAERRMRHLALTEVKGRIADALIGLKEVFGCNEGGFISVPVSRQDIASYAGTTYETVFKLFTEWTAQQVIDTAGKQIRLLNEIALKAAIPR